MECFSAVKLATGYEVVIPESSKAWKRGWKDKTGHLYSWV